MLLLELGLILLLLVANGVFAMTEIAIVSSRRSVLQARAEGGDRGSARALELAEHPNRFLSTVQIGITLVGIIAGAFGGARLAERVTPWFQQAPAINPWAEEIAFTLVIAVLTYLSLVIGELVPKRLAMSRPEAIASAMAAPMAWLSAAARPFVALLSSSTRLLLRLVGVRETQEQRMTREEFTVLLREGLVTGSTDQAETRMIEGVFGFENRDVYDLMIPRPRIDWLSVDDNDEAIFAQVHKSSQDVFPVFQSDRDNVLGVVGLKDLCRPSGSNALDLRQLLRPPLFVPENQKASALLDDFRARGQRAALVLDEFGSVIGMVTLIDVMESIVGEVPSAEEQLAQPIRARDDGSFLIDGLCDIEKVVQALPGFVLPPGGGDEFQTVAGWFNRDLARLPEEGERLEFGGWIFEVIDMDQARIDKVLASPRPAAAGEDQAQPMSADSGDLSPEKNPAAPPAGES